MQGVGKKLCTRDEARLLLDLKPVKFLTTVSPTAIVVSLAETAPDKFHFAVDSAAYYTCDTMDEMTAYVFHKFMHSQQGLSGPTLNVYANELTVTPGRVPTHRTPFCGMVKAFREWKLTFSFADHKTAKQVDENLRAMLGRRDEIQKDLINLIE